MQLQPHQIEAHTMRRGDASQIDAILNFKSHGERARGFGREAKSETGFGTGEHSPFARSVLQFFKFEKLIGYVIARATVRLEAATVLVGALLTHAGLVTALRRSLTAVQMAQLILKHALKVGEALIGGQSPQAIQLLLLDLMSACVQCYYELSGTDEQGVLKMARAEGGRGVGAVKRKLDDMRRLRRRIRRAQ